MMKRGEEFLTIADYDKEMGTVTIVFQAMGKSTKDLAASEVGEEVVISLDRRVSLVSY